MSKPKGSGPRIETTTLKPTEATAAIRHMIQVNIANANMNKDRRGLFIWGPPGIAKSSIVRQICKEINYKLIDIRLTQMEPTDLRGIPVPKKLESGEVAVNWAIPAMLPRRDEGKKTGTIEKPLTERRVLEDGTFDPTDTHYSGAIILLDELPNAAPSVQAGSYQLVLDGALGEYIAPSNVIVMAAGNRETDKGSTFKMPTPLMNRFTHIEMRHDFDDWLAYALNASFHRDVIGFLNAFKHELFVFEPSSASRGFATPRSWEAVSDIIREGAGLPEMVKLALITGAVGDGIAAKFLAFQKHASQLPNPSDILDGNVQGFNAKGDVSLMYALTTAMAYELRERHEQFQKVGTKYKSTYDKSFDNFLGFLMKEFPPEIVIMGARTVLSTMKLLIDTKALTNFKEFAKDYQSLILAA